MENSEYMTNLQELPKLRILYFLEPTLEMSDPLFRYGSLKSIIIPEAKAISAVSDIKTSERPVQTGIILSDAVYRHALKNGLDFGDFVPFVINSRSCEDDQIKRAHADFKPHLVIAYENYREDLDNIFCGASVLHMIFGPYSRFPYPTCHTYDRIGIYGNSKYISENSIVSSDETEIKGCDDFIEKFSSGSLQILAKYTPYKKYVHDLFSRYKNIIMFAAQIDHHPAFSRCSNFSDHASALTYVLENSDSDVCVVVTQHPYRQTFNEDQIKEFANKFTNVEFLPPDLVVTDSSQFLIPYCSGLVTASSNLGNQAVLFGIPILTLGKSHLDIYSVYKDVNDFYEAVVSGQNHNQCKMNRTALANQIQKNVRLFRHTIKNSESYIKFLIYKSGLDHTIFPWFEELDSENESHDWNYISTSLNERAVREASTKWKLPDGYSPGDLMLQTVAEHEVLSFDLFDTLVQRPLSKPHLLFRLIEPKAKEIAGQYKLDFWLIRREAEADVRRPTRGQHEITLDQIYDRFQELSGVSNDVKSSLMQLEMDAELGVCKRKEGVLFYKDLAERLGRKTGIISDFYIEEPFVQKLLEKNGITYDFLFVSATEGTRKHNGTIFPLLIKWAHEHSFEKDRIVHIGDNKIADLQMARASGIHALWFPQAIENFGRSKIAKEGFRSAQNSDSICDAIVTGLIAAKFFAAPFNQILSDRYIPSNHYALGYACYGPLLLGFTNWLYATSKAQGIKKIYFLSRDGYALQKAFDAMFGAHMESSYLYASRKSYSLAASQSKEDLESLASFSFNSQRFSDFSLNRFGFNITEENSNLLFPKGLSAKTIVSYPHHIGKIFEWISLNLAVLLRHCQHERDFLLKYLDLEGIKIGGQPPAIVDLGYSGTMQVKLDQLLDKKTTGFYFLSHLSASKQLKHSNCFAYLTNFDDHFSKFRDPYNDHVFIFEAAFSAPHPTVVSFAHETNNGVGFGKPGVEEDNYRILERIQTGMQDFISDALQSFGDHLYDLHISPNLARASLISFSGNPSFHDSSLFSGFGVENNFGGGSVYLIHPQDEGALSNDMLKFRIDGSKWKQGANAFYNSKSVNKQTTASVAKTKFDHNSTVSRIAPNGTVKVAVQSRNRKIGKLKQNPYLFFHDAKSAPLRSLKALFAPNLVGRINTVILRSVLSATGN